MRFARGPVFGLPLCSLLCSLLGVLVPSVASADVVPDLLCPPGLDIRGWHSRDCWPRACTRDAECGAGAACRAVARCLETRSIREGDSPEATPRVEDRGACPSDGACSVGRCEHLRRCEPIEATPAFVEGIWTGQPHRAPSHDEVPRPVELPRRALCSVSPGLASTRGLAPLALFCASAVLVRRRAARSRRA